MAQFEFGAMAILAPLELVCDESTAVLALASVTIESAFAGCMTASVNKTKSTATSFRDIGIGRSMD